MTNVLFNPTIERKIKMAYKSKKHINKKSSNYEQQPQDRLIRIEEVQRILGVGRTSVYDLIRAGKLDAPFKIGRSSLWSLNATNLFIESLKIKAVA